MSDSNTEKNKDVDKLVSARPDSEYDESTDYPLHKPFTIKEYIKLVSYVIIAIVGGVAIAVLVFLANR